MADPIVWTPVHGWPHKELLYETCDGGKIAKITINRPERMNSSDPGMGARFSDAWTRFADDDNQWVAIVTGAGDRAFSAGQDLKIRAELEEEGGDAPYRYRGRTFDLRWGLNCWKPTIAAINGYAIAGGFGTAMNCTFRIADEHAELNVAEARWNQGTGPAATLPKFILMGHALEVSMLADRRVTAQRAYEMGFVNKVVPKGKCVEEAVDWARTICHMAPRAIRNIHETVYRTVGMSIQESASFGAYLSMNLRGMEDSLEGPKAFAEKRAPNFKNR